MEPRYRFKGVLKSLFRVIFSEKNKSSFTTKIFQFLMKLVSYVVQYRNFENL